MEFKKAEIKSQIVKAMAHPVRLILIDFLKDGEKRFSEIFKLFKLDKSTVSKHLHVLKKEGILSARKEGVAMLYKLEIPCVMNFFGCIDAVVKSRLKTHNDFFKTKKGERKK